MNTTRLSRIAIILTTAAVMFACSPDVTTSPSLETHSARATTAATVVSRTVVPGQATICVGQSLDFDLVDTYDDGSTKEVKQANWSVGDPTVLDLRSQGVVTALAVGRSSVVAQYPVGYFAVAIADVVAC